LTSVRTAAKRGSKAGLPFPARVLRAVKYFAGFIFDFGSIAEFVGGGVVGKATPGNVQRWDFHLGRGD
jgi:hypothetical protein